MAKNVLVWIVPDLGHYHVPRISAFARFETADVHVVELSDTGGFAQFRADENRSNGFTSHTLFHGIYYTDLNRRQLRLKLFGILEQLRPTVSLVQGWAEPFALLQLGWSLRHRVPAIVTSESTADDAPRDWRRERIKARVIKLFGSGLVGGRAHEKYLNQLGMPEDRIFQGYDVVDNDFFNRGASAARARGNLAREEKGLPRAYFLASARFVEKKNLGRLIEAYSIYWRDARQQADGDPWSLVILGDGTLRSDLEKQVNDLGLGACVRMPGFQSYQELPVFYGLAGAFVHSSTSEQWGLVVNEAMAAGLPVIVSQRCGCVNELISEGENGFRFEPKDVTSLARILERVASSPPSVLAAMGDASRRRVAEWSPARFAKGLQGAVETAMIRPRPPGGFIDYALLNALILTAKHQVH